MEMKLIVLQSASFFLKKLLQMMLFLPQNDASQTYLQGNFRLLSILEVAEWTKSPLKNARLEHQNEFHPQRLIIVHFPRGKWPQMGPQIKLMKVNLSLIEAHFE